MAAERVEHSEIDRPGHALATRHEGDHAARMLGREARPRGIGRKEPPRDEW